MQLTAAILNAGLGDLTIGLEMAGFRVIAAYETDEKSIAIHEANLDVPIYRLTADTCYVEEKVDLIIAFLLVVLLGGIDSFKVAPPDGAADGCG